MEGARERPYRPPLPRSQQQDTGSRTQVDNYTKIKELYDEAYLYIDQGLTCDEQGQREQALTLYTKGLRCVEQAHHLGAEMGQDQSNPKWTKLHKMMSKMERTKIQIRSRVETLIQTDSAAGRAVVDPPPSYEEATTPTQSDFDIALADSIMNEDVSNHERSLVGIDASVLFSIRDGVQMFFITPEGYVSAPSYPSSLTVYKFTDSPQPGTSNAERPPAFLKVGDWTYPLLPGRSPALHASWGAYIFPNVNAVEEGSTVGVIIPESVTAEDRRKLEQLFSALTDYHVQEPSPTRELPPSEIPPEVRGATAVPPRPKPPQTKEDSKTSEKISSGIITAAEWISWGLVKGAEQTGKLMKLGSEKVKEKLEPELKKAEIDPNLRQGVYFAKQASGVAVKVSGFLVENLGKATMAIGRQVAPHIKKQGEKLLPKSMTQTEADGTSKLDGVVTVAAGGLKGWATVHTGLEAAAKHLAKNIRSETVNIVNHKYGKEAGEFTDDTMTSAFNVGYSAYTFSHLGVKAIAKRAVKDTGAAYVETEAQRLARLERQEQNSQRTQGQNGERNYRQTGSGGTIPDHMLPENKMDYQ